MEWNTVTHSNSEMKSSEAYNKYNDWTLKNGHFAVGNKTFKSSLEERGFYIKKKNDGNYWQGFGLPFDLK